MPVRKIPGIGNVCQQLLTGIGIETCGQIIERAVDIRVCFSDTSLDFFLAAALGIARSVHEPPQERKSFSVSRTFRTAIKTIQEFEDKLEMLSILLAEDLEMHESKGLNLCVTIKTAKFEVRTKN